MQKNKVETPKKLVRQGHTKTNEETSKLKVCSQMPKILKVVQTEKRQHQNLVRQGPPIVKKNERKRELHSNRKKQSELVRTNVFDKETGQKKTPKMKVKMRGTP